MTVTDPATAPAVLDEADAPDPVPARRRGGRVVVHLAVLAVVLVVAVVLVALVAYRQRLAITNVDGISYMSIARQYATGDFADAVNAYWSPAVSWLMAPLVALGLGLQTAFGAVNTAAAAVVVGVGGWLAWSQTRRLVPPLFYMVTVTPALMSAVPAQTPDLLVVAWFLCFLWALRTADRSLVGPLRGRIAAGAVLGAVGAVGYFVKLYTLPVTVVAVVVWLLLRLWSRRRRGERDRRTWVTPVAAVVAFAVVAAPWVGVLSAKYEGFTLGSSLAVNFGSKFDDAGHGSGWPFLPVPPNDSAVSPNEDFSPDVYGRGPQDDPDPLPTPEVAGAAPAADAQAAPQEDTASSDGGIVAKARYYLHQRVLAFPFYLARISGYAPFVVPIGLLFAAAVTVGVVRFRRNAFACIAAATTFVYFLGYAGITSAASRGGNIRYYWPLFYGTVLLAALMLPMVWRLVRRRGWLRIAVTVVAVLAVTVASYSQNWLGRQAPFYASTSNGTPLNVFGPTPVPEVSRLADQVIADGAVPADARIIGTNYRTLTSLGFLIDAHVYGRSAQGYRYDSEPQRELFLDQGVQYFVQFDPVGSPERDYSSAGTLVGTYEATVPCASDTSSESPMPCRVQFVELRR
ncbi:hypothetical protein [Curtobacterium sp. MCSS17_008]|uniref:hypothetical protein n=1 Tax=Curtobacterium sp. MCSS17_008 TaxID=2175647 RepID=UPI0011B58FD7|nr:hypothetical protein [Curtobacterium sp. MCSS17_008]